MDAQEVKFRLYKDGRRRFVTASERKEFLEQALSAPAHHRTLCLTLAHTGCHINEALDLTASSFDFASDAILVADSQKRCRSMPVPIEVLNTIDVIHSLRRAQKRPDAGASHKLWDIDRTTAWRWVSAIMKKADIHGPQATPRGLRHGFAIQSLSDGLPLHTVHHWMGYQDIDTTRLYETALNDLADET